MARKIVYIALSLLIVVTMGFIFNNSLDSGEQSNEKSDAVTEVIKPIIEDITTSESILDNISELVRKAAHFFEFMVLGIEAYLLAVLLSKKATGIFTFIPLFGTLFTAVIDEFIQSFTGRTSSLKDVLIDFSGALIGMLLVSGVDAIVQAVINHKRYKLQAQ